MMWETDDDLEPLDEIEINQGKVIEQEMVESDEAFEAWKAKAAAKKAAMDAEKDAAAKYIQKARGGDLDVFHNIRKRIKLGRREKKPFDMFLTTMWRTKYTKEAHQVAKNMPRKGAGYQRAKEQCHCQKVDNRLWVEENSQGEAEVPRHAEENAQMWVEEHSQGDVEAPSHEEEAQILPPENDHCAEDACQLAEENCQPREEENH
ncbi:hypothetical protein BS47DRAFT_1357773 [Hydnum rufescens UP504]|uniref:Uncharacterized protein n=1 Tax=Hydnum rufescens UP504 TaxID=1448309 RepID=A0A9P6B963_9AGAM|nr:hypothetical protein BS47DRAFT_1357773 [Hydnum rufescens UP504]